MQSKIIEPACAEFSATQVGNSAKWISSNLVIHVNGVYKLSVMSPIKSLRPKWAQGRQSSSLISQTKDCRCLYHTKISITFQIFSLLFLWFMAFMARSIGREKKSQRTKIIRNNCYCAQTELRKKKDSFCLSIDYRVNGKTVPGKCHLIYLALILLTFV